MKKISVIVPLFNSQDYIAECLKSIQNQTFSDFHAVICDNGSTDNSLEIAQATVDGDPRFLFVREEKRGIEHALNRALNHADAEWIAFLDHDDIYHPEKLVRSLSSVATNNADMSLCRAQFIDSFSNPLLDENGSFIYTKSLNFSVESLSLIMGTENIINTLSNIFINFEVLKNFLPFTSDYNLALDYYLLFNFLSSDFKTALVDYNLVYRRIHKASASRVNQTNQKKQGNQLKSIFLQSFPNIDKAIKILVSNKIIIESFQKLRRVDSIDSFFEIFGKSTPRHIDPVIFLYFKWLSEEQKQNIVYKIDHPLVYFAKGIFSKKCDKSRWYFEKACQTSFYFPEAQNNLAVKYVNKSKLKSLQILSQVLFFFPEYQDAKYNLYCLDNNIISDLKITKWITEQSLINFAYQYALRCVH